MVTQTYKNGREIGYIDLIKFDCDCNGANGQKDFEAEQSASIWDNSITAGCRLFVAGTEYGGIVGEIKSETAYNRVTIKGFSWRGVLEKHIVRPPSGSSYLTLSGDLNEIIAQLITLTGIGSLFVASTETTESITYQFPRYITLLDALYGMLEANGYRLDIVYVQGEQGTPGMVQLAAVGARSFTDQIELSQDYGVDFTASAVKNGTNHLVCLGKGELTARVIVDLYMQADGTVGRTPYYTGIDEIAETYENTNAEAADLIEKGTERLLKEANSDSLNMAPSDLSIPAQIGDIIGGRDYITGISMETPIADIIYIEEDGTAKIQYKLKGEK